MKIPTLNKWQIAAIIIVIVIVVSLAVYHSKNKPLTMSKQVYNQFFDELVKYVQKAEGGLSNDKADSASSNPSPTPEKWHTNKGVTWTTFVNSAKELDYTPSVANFLEMPNSIWLKIFDKKYISKAEKISKNPVLRSYIGLWFWGGTSKALLERAKAPLLNDKLTDLEKLRALVDLRKDYFDRVIAAKPQNAKFEKGWKNRAEDYYTQFKKYVA
jgi:hypothetical protein